MPECQERLFECLGPCASVKFVTDWISRKNEAHWAIGIVFNRVAPVAQLDRALPSEGKGHTFESCRVRQGIKDLAQKT